MPDALTAHLLALLIGVVAGLRAMTAPAAVSWAAHLGWLDVSGTWLAFLGTAVTPLDPDRLRARRARHRPAPVDAQPHGAGPVRRPHPDRSALRRGDRRAERARWWAVFWPGRVGAVIGTLGGRALRARLAAAFGERPPRRPHRGRGGHRRRAADRPGAAMTRFDAIIIGAGQAGPPLAGRLTARRHERRLRRARASSAGRASTPAACRRRRSSPAPMPRTSPAAAPTTASPSSGAIAIDMARVKARADAVVDERADGRREVAARHGRAAR